MLRKGKLENRFVDLDISDRSMPMVEIFSNVGMEEMGINFKDMLGGVFPKSTKRRKVKVPEAMEILVQEEAQGLVDMDKVIKQATPLQERACTQNGLMKTNHRHDRLCQRCDKTVSERDERQCKSVDTDKLFIIEESPLLSEQ